MAHIWHTPNTNIGTQSFTTMKVYFCQDIKKTFMNYHLAGALMKYFNEVSLIWVFEMS